MTNILEVNNLKKFFPTQNRMFKGFGNQSPSHLLHAVDDASFSLAARESVGLVGESGCGKSTLVRLITRLIDPTGGNIWFDGENIARIPAREFSRHGARSQIQLVFQDPHDSLNPRFTAFDSIAEPLKRWGTISRGDRLRKRVEELADRVGLPQNLLTRFPHQLSGGQKARVGIARAIALNPKLLILDEPTSALDVSVQAIILRLLADLQQTLGMSYLFVSHDLNVVRLLCDRVIVMYLGKIVEIGSTRALFRQPLHPYTQALIAAIPHANSRHCTVRLQGEPRSPIDPDPHICRFYGRCFKESEQCYQTMPLLLSKDSDRAVACHFPENQTEG
ncbi:MAG: ABC transporter ATP-binding protein [Cyanobacteria bacterium SBLK]|nr:ABC transporter ATP-binding protein [Cyanobacteria bacterium SBLK]